MGQSQTACLSIGRGLSSWMTSKSQETNSNYNHNNFQFQIPNFLPKRFKFKHLKSPRRFKPLWGLSLRTLSSIFFKGKRTPAVKFLPKKMPSLKAEMVLLIKAREKILIWRSKERVCRILGADQLLRSKRGKGKKMVEMGGIKARCIRWV